MKRIGLQLITASLIAGTAAPAAASTPSQSTQQWLDHCSASEVVTRRINELTAGEVAVATDLLRRANLFQAFAQLSPDEGCLSLAATAASQAPALVLNFQRTPGYGREVEAQLATGIHERLERMDIGYTLPDPELDAGSPMLELFQTRPKDAKKAFWQTFTSNLRVDSRSIAGMYAGHCVILHDTSPFGEFVNQRLRGPLDDHLAPEDRKWLTEHGEAIEFWHEVSHCEQNSLKAYDGPHGAGGLAEPDDSSAGNPSDGQALEDMPGVMDITQLGDEPEVSQCPASQSAFNSGQPGSMEPPPMTPEGREDISVGFLARLSSEVEADLFAQDALAHRFDLGQPGCRDFRDIRNMSPWGKFRLSMSMLHPEFHYMTWLNPWLHNLGTLDQMQVALEAWEANMAVAFDRLEVPNQSPLVRRIALRQDEVGVWNIAGHESDPKRVSNWESWLAGPFESQKETH